MIDYRLYLVTDTVMCGELGVAATVDAAITGGVTLVQVRDPHADDATFLRIAREVVRVAAGRVPVLLNDRVGLVNAAGADGAHIGQRDLAPLEARALLGPNALLGLSISTAEQLDAALPYRDQLDYLGIGPVWAQTTKTDAEPAIGAAALADLVAGSPLPSVAIGGINATNLVEIKRSGACGAAVVSAICGRPDPRGAAAELMEVWTR